MGPVYHVASADLERTRMLSPFRPEHGMNAVDSRLNLVALRNVDIWVLISV